jgi:hypothetical protein
MKSIRIIAALLLAGASIATAGAANAAPKIVVDLPNDAVAAGTVAQIPVTVTGLTWAKADVTVTSVDGDLTVVDPTSLLTLQPGYTGLTGTELSFYGNTADVVSILSNGLSWTSPQTAATNVLKFKISLAEHVDNQVVDPATGHSYRFVPNSGITWFDARTASHALSVSGHAGYLVAITSDAENQFVATKTDAENVWIGTSSDEATLGALNPAITGHVHNCEYYWADGSAAGQPTTTGCGTPAAVNGSYNSWAQGEPNNYGTTEACGVDNWGGSRGSWNDLDCDTDGAAGYLVEFDTSAADFEGKALVFNDLTGAGVDAVPAEVAVPLAKTGSSLFPAIELGAIVSIAGAVLLVVARRKAAKN